MTQAVDLVRRREYKELQKAGDKRLAKTKYLWLYGRENLPENYGDRFTAVVYGFSITHAKV